MPSVLDFFTQHEVRRFDPGQIVLQQGERTDLLFFLIEGAVEVLRDDTPIAQASQSGVVFGEMSVLLGGNHRATVRALKPCAFYVVRNPRAFLAATPEVCLHVCETLARRLDALSQYLVDVKQQFDGHDHIGMIGQVLETLMHREPRARVRPSESTIRQG